MGRVIYPRRWHPGRRRRHATRSRDASSVNTSAVTPALRATEVLKIPHHQSGGMKSRWCHFETADDFAPSAFASASRVAQSSMMDRKDVMASNHFVPANLGPAVLKRKRIFISYDATIEAWAIGQNVLDGTRINDVPSGVARARPKTTPNGDYKAAFMSRVKERRLKLEMTQQQMADLLGMRQDRYKIYETRTVMPAEIIALFCDRTDTRSDWLIGTVRRATQLRVVHED